MSAAAEYEAVVNSESRTANVTVGAKYDLRVATLRAQIDTAGRMAAVVEHRLQPNFAVLLSGELDHVSGQSRFGVGLSLN